MDIERHDRGIYRDTNGIENKNLAGGIEQKTARYKTTTYTNIYTRTYTN